VADRLSQAGVEAEVVDLRSLRPLDVETVVASVQKTSRALVAEEGWATFGVGAELAARIHDACFDDLDAPVARVGAPFTPVPFSPPLEDSYLPGAEEIVEACAR
jgi:pyruvate dehydrogenase E1 component beta subunit